jgi:phosphonatase-like hydrolase
MTAYSLAALDMAGTTVDEGGLVYAAVEAAVADAVGGAVPAELMQRWKGTSKEEAIEGLLRDLGEDASPERVAKVFDVFAEKITVAYRDTPPAPIAGVLETFERLRTAGVKVALQTGYSAEIAGSILDGLGWTVGGPGGGTVDALVTSDLVPLSRPAPYLIFRCMEATGVTDVRRVLAAGDTPHDLGAGTRAGAGFVVGVTTGSFTREQLEAEPHTHVLDSIAGITALL